MQVGFQTNRGHKRQLNEDALLVLKEEKVFLVADGVGGHNAGEVASKMAVGLIEAYIAEHLLGQVQGADAVRSYFLDCLRRANGAIAQLAAENLQNQGMATTAVLAYVAEGNAFLANVGDSRAYLLRDGVLRQLTEDHTFVNQLLKEGTITSQEARNHPNRNMITRALGGDVDVEPDFYRFPVYEGDVLLLCSDGLYNEVSEAEMVQEAGKTGDMQLLAERLVEMANHNGGSDNITVICVQTGIEEEEV